MNVIDILLQIHHQDYGPPIKKNPLSVEVVSYFYHHIKIIVYDHRSNFDVHQRTTKTCIL